MLISIAAFLMLVFGAVLAIGGAWLILLGGSWYYLIVGIAFLVTAWLLYRRNGAALWLYTAILVGTLVWAIWETGFDWWSLGPRGGIVVLLALLLLLPGIRRQLPGSGGAALAVGVLAALVVAVYSMVIDARDLANSLPAAQSTAAANLGDSMSPGDWHLYGRSTFGQRYSPLTQITTGNVGTLTEVWRYRTGDVRTSADVPETTYQVTPIKIGDMLYLCTPHSLAIAADAATGTERWRFDPKVGLEKDRQHQTCRGVSYFAARPDSLAASASFCRPPMPA